MQGQAWGEHRAPGVGGGVRGTRTRHLPRSSRIRLHRWAVAGDQARLGRPVSRCLGARRL